MRWSHLRFKNYLSWRETCYFLTQLRNKIQILQQKRPSGSKCDSGHAKHTMKYNATPASIFASWCSCCREKAAQDFSFVAWFTQKIQQWPAEADQEFACSAKNTDYFIPGKLDTTLWSWEEMTFKSNSSSTEVAGYWQTLLLLPISYEWYSYL